MKKEKRISCERCASQKHDAKHFRYGHTEYRLCEECFYETVYETANWHVVLVRHMSVSVSPDPSVPW